MEKRTTGKNEFTNISCGFKKLTVAELKAINKHKKLLCTQKGYDVTIEYAIIDWIRHQSRSWREERIKRDAKKQIDEMLKHKWIESQKAGKDLGKKAFIDWINKHAIQWRKWRDTQLD